MTIHNWSRIGQRSLDRWTRDLVGIAVRVEVAASANAALIDGHGKRSGGRLMLFRAASANAALIDGHLPDGLATNITGSRRIGQRCLDRWTRRDRRLPRHVPVPHRPTLP